MKNKRIYLSASLALLVFASCTNDMQELETNQPQLLKQIVMTTEDFLSETGSRTLYDIADGAVTCTWAENDTVGVFPNEGIQTAFPMASGAGTKNATFDGGGWALKDGSTYGAYYPCIGKFYLDKHAVPVSYEGQTQVGNASMAHLGAYDYMVATPVAPEFGSANFMFKHLSALVQLKITIPEPATLTSVKLVADTESFAVMGKVDIMADAPSITAVTSASKVELTLQEVSTTEENQVVTLYLMLPPADLSAQTLKAVVTTDKGTLEMALENKNFQAGKVYALSGEMKGDYKSGVATLIEAGTLQQLLGDDWLDITSLKVVGPINGDDVRCLRQMLGGEIEFGVNVEKGNLITLDLSEAMIVGGGNWYYKNIYTYNYTSNDKIGNYMFDNCVNLQSIILPDAVTSIGQSAFSDCKALTSIDLPDGVTSIGDWAFAYCYALPSIDIPDGITSIGSYTFTDCDAFTSIDIPNGVTSIGEDAFSYCEALTSVTMGDGVTIIGEDAFYYCDALTSVTIGDHVTSIGKYAFASCKVLTSIDLPEGVTSIGDGAFAYCYALPSIDIPDGITSIGSYTFTDCDAFTSIDIPNGVTTIGERAFSGCSSLATLQIGNGVSSIGNNAFSGCDALHSVYITDLSAWCSIDFSNGDYTNPLSHGIKLYLNNEELTELVIPKGVKGIKSKAFIGCRSLKKVTVGNDVTSIGYAAFANCKSLATVNILDGVATIDASAYSNCSSLTSVKIDAKITSIKDATFQYCYALSTISINKGVVSIGCKTFADSSNITEFYCYSIEPPSIIVDRYEGTFSTADFKNRILYVPRESVSKYQSSKWSSIFGTIVEIE